MKDENYKENCRDWKHSQGHWVYGFTSEDYKDRGLYIPELVDINEVGDKLLPQIVSNAMRMDLRRFGSIDKVPKKI